MKVGIDISSVVYKRGVSRYTYNLVKALLRFTPDSYQLFGTSWGQYPLLNQIANSLIATSPQKCTSHLLKLPPAALGAAWQWQLAPVTTWLPKISVFHSWDWQQPPDRKLPLVSTIHDLAILKYPDVAHPKVLAAHQRSWEILKKRRAQIIAVSQSTKSDIVSLLGISASQITVVPEALPTEFEALAAKIAENDAPTVVKKLGCSQPYLFFIGTQEPRKNLLRLIEAWQPLSKDVGLVIAGANGWGQQTPPHGPQPLFLGQVSDTQLISLYRQAAAFVYPSLDEGFGLPILEAFHLGVPVITSNRSATAEIAGNAALLADPESSESIRENITTILQETAAQKERRRQQMIIRLHQFSWKHTALRTAEVYQKAWNER